ncbi:hypothetical protein ACWDOR_16585 [Streptosporangium canum]|uniref:hypothetical protein n=1 Tax=Streptosporangium canum TaxID=324952 RepID=UPI00368D6D82
MKWVPRLGAVLLVAGLIAGALGVFAFSRASETAARLDGHLQKATELLREAEAVKATEPERYEMLRQDADRRAGFAESDQEEHSSQLQGGWILTGAGGAGLVGGVVLLALHRFRIRPRQAGRTASRPSGQQADMWPNAR